MRIYDQDAAEDLLVALHHLRLDLAMCSWGGIEMLQARGALVEAWAAAAAGAGVWESRRAVVAHRLAELGPSHRASLLALSCPLACNSQHLAELAQWSALALVKRLFRGKVWFESLDT